MNYANLIQNITENIKTNGSQAITAQVLQDVLVDMVGELGQSGALLGGVIDTSFVPDLTNDAQVVYIAESPGTYTNFNGLVVGAGEVAFFYFNGNAWAKSSVDVLEVVNNLNSTATDKALSAAMGKQIGDNISQLDVNFGEAEVVSKNILAPSMILARTGYLRRDNGNPASGGFGYTDYFELGENGLSCNNALPTSGSYACPAVLYDANKVFVRYSTSNVNAITNPDIRYVRFNLGNPDLLPDGEDYAVYNTLYVLGYDEYKVNRKIGEKKIEKDMLQDDAVPANSLLKTETLAFPNLFNKESRRPNSIINASNGIDNPSNDSFSSNYIAIPSGASSLYITNVRLYGVSGWAAYDSSFQFTHGSSGTNLVTVREGDAYIRFCAYNEDLDIVMVVAGTSSDVPTEYVPYGVNERYSLKQNTVGTEELKNESVTDEKLAVKKVDVKAGKNKCNPKDPNFKLNYQITSTTGQEFEWTGSYVGRVGCTGYIPVSENGLILNHYSAIGATSGMAVYDINKVYIRGAGTGVYSYQPGDAYVRFTFGYAYRDEIQVEEGAEITPYEPFSPIGGYGVVSEGNVASLVSEELAYNLKIQLPNVIYAIVGTQVYLWNDAISYSIDRGLNSPMNYSVYWYSGNIGVITERGFKYTPEDSHAGHSYTVRCDLYSVTGVLVSQKSFTIKVLAKNALASAKKIVFFGDSTGAQTATNMYDDFHNSEKFTGVAPTMLGSRGGSTIRYDAVGGYAWADYATQGRAAFRCFVTNAPAIPLNAKYTNNGFTWEVVEVNVTNGVGNILITKDSTTYTDTPSASGVLVAVSSGVSNIPYDSYENAPANPLWDSNSNSLSIAHYKDIVGISQTDHFDAVSFLLGLNGNPTSEQTTAYIKSLYNVFVEDNPDCLFLLALVTSCGNTQDGFGASFGASINSMTNMKKTFALRELYLQLREDPELPNLRIVPAHTELDRYYGYGFSTRQISQRYTENEQGHNNAVHPASSGYGQLGDCFFAAFIGALTEE